MPKSKKDGSKFQGEFLARRPHANAYVEQDGVTPYLEAWKVDDYVAKVKANREAATLAAQSKAKGDK